MGERILKDAKITEITPSMEDVFAYLVKEESGKEMKGGRVSGAGQSSVKIKTSAVKEG